MTSYTTYLPRFKGQRCISEIKMAAEAKVTHVVVFPKFCFFCIENFHHLLTFFKQEVTSLRKGRDEESVDKTVLQKYHRGRQNRFKVSSCFYSVSRIPQALLLFSSRAVASHVFIDFLSVRI